MSRDISIVIPARNESESLEELLPKLVATFPKAEIVLVDDGSSDNTVETGNKYSVRVVSHPYSMGNGAAIKTGVRKATHDVVVCMDADGQHDPGNIQKLINEIDSGYDMVVGARSKKSQASPARGLANRIYNSLASYMVGRSVVDLTSGFRVFKKNKFLRFINLLPNGFSYPTTITMAFFRAGYSVQYLPIEAKQRIGKSHIHLLKDGIRFFMIIFKVGTLYSPLKIFLPISVTSFLLGCGYYLFTFLTEQRFTNMSLLFFTNAIIVFLMGLISEQITSLAYQQVSRGKDSVGSD